MENVRILLPLCYVPACLVLLQPTHQLPYEQNPCDKVHVLPDEPYLLHALPLLDSVAPPQVTIRDYLFPHWYEIVIVSWYSGELLAEFTNPGAKRGLSWVKSMKVILGICAVIIHISAIYVDPFHWSLMMYIRNQFILLMCWIQVFQDFLAFNPLFGPWAIIIGECLKDVGKFVVVLILFLTGYALLGTTINQPNDKKLNPKNLMQKALYEDKVDEEAVQPFLMFEILFFALFGITNYDDMKVSNYIQPWTYYMFKAVFATYLTMTIIVLINLLIAMMSDTCCRIQDKSDIGNGYTIIWTVFILFP